MYDSRYQSVDFLDVDYGAAARAFNCSGVRVESAEGLAPAFAWALEASADNPVVVDVLTTTDPARMLPSPDSRTAAATHAGESSLG